MTTFLEDSRLLRCGLMWSVYLWDLLKNVKIMWNCIFFPKIWTNRGTVCFPEVTGCARCAELTRSPWRPTTVRTRTPVGESKLRTHCPSRTRGWVAGYNQFGFCAAVKWIKVKIIKHKNVLFFFYSSNCQYLFPWLCYEQMFLMTEYISVYVCVSCAEVWEADSAVVLSHTQRSVPWTCQPPGQSNRFVLKPVL